MRKYIIIKDYLQICDNIVDIILGYRIPLESDTEFSNNNLKEIIKSKVIYFVQNNMPIEFSISAFSLKSQIPGKCISYFPDMAEFEALSLFNQIINEISFIYNKGANINIFADGRIFVGLLYGFTDELVTIYLEYLKKFASIINQNNIKITSLENILGNNHIDSRKLLFFENYVDNQKLLEDMKQTEYGKNLITYIRDFYAKDIRKPFGLSINNSRIEGLKMAIGVLSASKSWGEIIKAETDKNCIRLSCHPRPYIYEPGKIGIYMNRLKIKSCMPWHGVAVKLKEGFIYKRKESIVSIGAIFKENNGLPYYDMNNIDYFI